MVADSTCHVSGSGTFLGSSSRRWLTVCQVPGTRYHLLQLAIKSAGVSKYASRRSLYLLIICTTPGILMCPSGTGCHWLTAVPSLYAADQRQTSMTHVHRARFHFRRTDKSLASLSICLPPAGRSSSSLRSRLRMLRSVSGAGPCECGSGANAGLGCPGSRALSSPHRIQGIARRFTLILLPRHPEIQSPWCKRMA